jgi:hypothetical protein
LFDAKDFRNQILHACFTASLSPDRPESVTQLLTQISDAIDVQAR